MPKPLVPGFTPFSFRTGSEQIPKFGGMRREGPRYAVPANKFWNLQNVRLVGGEVVARGGQSKLNSGSALSGCLYGMGELNDEDGEGAFGIFAATSAGGPNRGLFVYNPELSPADQITNDALVTSAQADVFKYGDKLILINTVGYEIDLTPDGVGGLVSEKRQIFVVPSGSIPNGSTIGNTHHAAVEAPTVDSSRPGEKDLWFITTTGVLYRWTGAQLIEDATGLGTPNLLFYFNEDLYVMGDGSLVKRDGGSWTTVTLPALDGTFEPNSYEPYKGDMYIGGIDDDVTNKILKISNTDGTTVTVANSAGAGGGESNFPELSDMAAFDGYLFYLNYDGDDSTQYLGRFDGSTWLDTHKDMDAELGLENKLVSMLSFRGSLFCVDDGGDSDLYKSPGTVTSGTWENVSSTSTADLISGETLTVF